jgi:hypothetical protein
LTRCARGSPANRAQFFRDVPVPFRGFNRPGADDDQIAPHKDAALLQAKLTKNTTLKVYLGYSHGTLTVNDDVINPDLLAVIKS